MTAFRLLCLAAILLSLAANVRAVLGNNEHDKEVYDMCQYTVQPGDTLTKIANYLSDYLPLQDKDCWTCPGGTQQCARPASQCAKCGHKGDYVALWKFNGACTNGFSNPDKIKVQKTILFFILLFWHFTDPSHQNIECCRSASS